MSDTLTIILVEDDDVEVMSVRRALRVLRLPHELIVARDGVEALALLHGRDVRSVPIPLKYVIFLDINMPRMNGLEFLRELRRDPQHKGAPVVILTTSTADADRQAACEAHVENYIVKSSLGGGFLAFAYAIDGCLARLADVLSQRVTVL